MLKLKEGQTYICIKAEDIWWCEGQEYQVVVDSYGKLALKDNNGTCWNERLLNDLSTYFKLKESEPRNQFKLKEKSHSSELDLNKLTLEELEEYLRLATALEGAEYLMKYFIERVNKKWWK